MRLRVSICLSIFLYYINSYLNCLKKQQNQDLVVLAEVYWISPPPPRYSAPKNHWRELWETWLQSLLVRSQQRSQHCYFKASSVRGPHTDKSGQRGASSGTLRSLCSFKLQPGKFAEGISEPYSLSRWKDTTRNPLLWSCGAHQRDACARTLPPPLPSAFLQPTHSSYLCSQIL